MSKTHTHTHPHTHTHTHIHMMTLEWAGKMDGKIEKDEKMQHQWEGLIWSGFFIDGRTKRQKYHQRNYTPYFNSPSLFRGKIWTPPPPQPLLFGRIKKNSTPLRSLRIFSNYEKLWKMTIKLLFFNKLSISVDMNGAPQGNFLSIPFF